MSKCHSQFGLLTHLHGASLGGSGGISISALAERLGLDPTTLNRNLKLLVAQGFVGAGADPSDRRVRAMHITKKGRGKLEEAAPFWRKAQARVEEAFGIEATLALDGLLELFYVKTDATVPHDARNA